MSHSHLLLNITSYNLVLYLTFMAQQEKNKQNTLLQEGDELVNIKSMKLSNQTKNYTYIN
jgi:hypothetical protein